jgi:hypothetical protein
LILEFLDVASHKKQKRMAKPSIELQRFALKPKNNKRIKASPENV